MVDAPNQLDRPAFYALRPGGWRDLLTLLHPPYTAWHLSYVALGAVAAPELHGDRLAATLLAFFLGVGVCAHALDELNGRGPPPAGVPPRPVGAGGAVASRSGADRHRRRGDRVAVPAALRRRRGFHRRGVQPRALRRLVSLGF